MATRLTVIGAGPGGYVAAIRAAQMGAEVTVIEQENVGGTCLNWGCIPSKVMITTAELLEKFHRAQEFGVAVEGPVRPDMQRLMARKAKIIQDQSKGILNLFGRHSIRYILGKGEIAGPNLARATDADGQVHEIPWDKLIIATGTRPLNIPALPFDGQRILSSNDALSLEEIPESIVIVGGGVIGCEFAFILNALGARVTVVEALPRLLPLPSVDEDCSKILQREMKKKKINFLVNRTVESYEQVDGKLRLTIGPSPFMEKPGPKDQKPLSLDAEKMLICIGRQANSQGIGLETIGVTPDERGWIETDERMMTCARDVYAIGDILGPAKIMLAHVASAEGEVAVDNALGAGSIMDYNAVPGAIFTTPEVANVGLTEHQAREQGINVQAGSVLFRSLGKAQVIGEIAGQAKIVADADSGRIVGVHIIGPHATDLIGEGTLAIKSGLTVKALTETIHAHPTLSEIMLETGFKTIGHALHG